jgi:hypothetical protein
MNGLKVNHRLGGELAAKMAAEGFVVPCENQCDDHHLSVGEGHHQCPKDGDIQVF